ncbi:hypothetical protein QUF64_08785 [Anaerolineales bacterium HSG6]|nr:hypothetical protein [Anaerolineales bacterium HSG6]
MKTFIKESFVPTLIILVASALVILAVLPLAQTDWAETVRSSPEHEQEDMEPSSAEGEYAELPFAIVGFVLSFIKVTMQMGIGGLLTALVLWISKKIRHVLQGRHV